MDSLNQYLSELLGTGGTAASAIAAIGIAYFGGILASLTPCVYPMIPITISVVGGLGTNNPADKEKSWKNLILRAVLYILGMTLIYSILGVAAGITGRIFGSFTNTSAWYLGLGVVMTLSSLIMLDIIPFDPLAFWNRLKYFFGSKLSKNKAIAPIAAQKEVTFFGSFFLGASSGFIAAPCTTPVLTAILAYITNTQSVFLGFALMTAFSLGLGTLLILVALFTGGIQFLPRSGKWMKTIKILSGLLLLGFAEYLIYLSGTVSN